MNITKEQLKALVSSAVKDQIQKKQEVTETKTRLTRSELKEMVKEMIKKAMVEQETRDGHNYDEFFLLKMKEMYGTEKLSDLSDDERKKFFDAVDHDWKAKDEPINEVYGACDNCGCSYAECECEDEEEEDKEKNEGAMCEKCGKSHNEMSECGSGYTKTTVMESSEFVNIVEKMIAEESEKIRKDFRF